MVAVVLLPIILVGVFGGLWRASAKRKTARKQSALLLEGKEHGAPQLRKQQTTRSDTLAVLSDGVGRTENAMYDML